MSTPFKMKGSPFQRNFNIGKTEAPNTESPYLELKTQMVIISKKSKRKIRLTLQKTYLAA